VFGGEVYRADAGFARTAIRSDAGFAVDNLDQVEVFAEGGIVEDAMRAGLFDGAEIRVSFVNWQDPDGHGEIRLRRGTLGETRLTPQGWEDARRGTAQRYRRLRYGRGSQHDWHLNTNASTIRTRFRPAISIPTTDGAELEGANSLPIVFLNNESYTIALLLKGRSGGASTKHLYR
jgi:hypothetical protein